ncbi:T9SS type A sorting domain-containing protein [Flavobacterium magnum]|uniref:T9SS type A sorting domain-containing protein n=1 Tax=Flavobacterium magnum TaxID=2162713 RepID=UPI0015E6AE93
MLRFNSDGLRITDLGSNTLSVYPNPASDFNFTLPQADEVTIGLFDISGKKAATSVSNTDFSAGLNSIKLNLPASLSTHLFPKNF